MHRQSNTKDTPTTSPTNSQQVIKVTNANTSPSETTAHSWVNQQHKSTAQHCLYVPTYLFAIQKLLSRTEKSPKLTSLLTLIRWHPNEFGQSQEMVWRTVGDMGVRLRSHENEKLHLWAVDHYGSSHYPKDERNIKAQPISCKTSPISCKAHQSMPKTTGT